VFECAGESGEVMRVSGGRVAFLVVDGIVTEQEQKDFNRNLLSAVISA